MGVFRLMNSFAHFRSTVHTLDQIIEIEKAIELSYRDNIAYAEQNCYGWTGTGCTTLTILPRKDTTDTSNKTLTLTTYSDAVKKAFEQAGCTATVGTVPVYAVKCIDKYGSNYTFSTTNEHTANTLYARGYNSTPYTILITAGGNADIKDTWSAGYLDSEYAAYSRTKIVDFAQALKTFHVTRLNHEAMINTCDSINGGLESFDDIIVPWYWQATSSASSTVECTGIESNNCGCSGFTSSVWATSGSGWNAADTATELTTLTNNLGLNVKYRVDGYGNPLQVWFTVNSGNALQTAPPRPQPNYDAQLALWIRPPYRGLIGVYDSGTAAWVYSDNVVYAQ